MIPPIYYLCIAIELYFGITQYNKYKGLQVYKAFNMEFSL